MCSKMVLEQCETTKCRRYKPDGQLQYGAEMFSFLSAKKYTVDRYLIFIRLDIYEDSL